MEAPNQYQEQLKGLDLGGSSDEEEDGESSDSKEDAASSESGGDSMEWEEN